MAAKACTDDEFIRLFESVGPTRTAEQIGVSVRAVNKRRVSLETTLRRQIVAPFTNQASTRVGAQHSGRVSLEVDEGVALVCSDGHYWPGPATTAHRAFVQFCKGAHLDTPVRAVIMNGDAFDGVSISRHPPIGWEAAPTVQEEIEAVQDRLHEIETASPRGCPLVWTLGNHDGRFETRLATVAREYAKLKGFHLQDHFPAWKPAWSCWINDEVVIKHRYKGGTHATHNNTLASGKTVITGHLHSLKVTPYNDYNGIRWGVDTGCLADHEAKAFLDYTEDNPKNWRSGFVVLTFNKGRLAWPEVVHVLNETEVEFRGKVITV